MIPIIILDLGSCHMGKLDYCLEAIDLCKSLGVNALKFQLFPKTMEGNNIWLDPELFRKACNHARKVGLEVFASIWDYSGYQCLLDNGCKSIKFAFSQRKSDLILPATKEFQNVFISYSWLDDFQFPWHPHVKNLWCIAEYPVEYKLDFTNRWPRFHGFSSHCLGIKQDLRAFQYGCEILEKHFCLDHDDITVPDSKFALRPSEVKELMTIIKTDVRYSTKVN